MDEHANHPDDPTTEDSLPEDSFPEDSHPGDAAGFNPTPLLLAFGLLAFVLAGLSIADMFIPRAYDGLALAAHGGEGLLVREVVPGSGAARAGIRPGDQIVGIARSAVNDLEGAGRALQQVRVGEEVLYLVRKRSRVVEAEVRLDRRRFGDGTYLFSSALGFSFFFVGLFVLLRQPLRRASQVFFLLTTFFLLFLVCRMRLPSYSSVDSFILGIGTVAFLLLPAAFLHFYLIFPRPAMLEALGRRLGGGRLVQGLRWAWPGIYLVPLVVFAVSLRLEPADGEPRLIHGTPLSHWWLLVIFMSLGLLALSWNARFLDEARQRRGIVLVLLGSVFGLAPFLVTSLVFHASLHSRAFFFFGVMPLVLVPITFAYAVVRFQLLDIRVILKKSLLYTVTTALVTGIYAGGIATFNALFRTTKLAATGYFPILLALAIVLLFEPLRRRLQELIDRYFFAERSRLQRAMVDLGEAVSAEVDLQVVVQELVERLPAILRLRFAALYLDRGEKLVRVAGPESLPAELPDLPEIAERLRRGKSLTRIEDLGGLGLTSRAAGELVERLAAADVEVLGDLSSPRRSIGVVLFSGKEGQLSLEREELKLLQGLLYQAALALETSLLLEERTQQAELERELEIAASIQERLLPDDLTFAPGWEVAAVCRPARIVGGDFFAQLPGPDGQGNAIVFGDVAGKSVSGALMMMAAHEVLHALALMEPHPSHLFTLANRRVHGIGRRNFVALGYFGVDGDGTLMYLVAGQPAPLLKRRDTVEELPLPDHRLPVGALAEGNYEALTATVAPGEVVVGYSDGVLDARSPAGEPFGEERFHDVVASAGASARETVGAVLEALDDHIEQAVQYDDLTLVAVGRKMDP